MPYLSFPLQNHKNIRFHDKVPMSIEYQNSKINATYNWLVAYQYNQDASQLLILILFVYPMFEFSTNVSEYRKRIAILFMNRF